jgi:tRNA (adenine37-N6)-methyltransferase
MQEIVYKTIGVIHSPFADVEGMPIQPRAASGVQGSIQLDPDLAPGLKDLEGFSHVILIYHFHLSARHSLEVKPFLDDTQRGVFSTRVPARPNAIGLSVVRLTGVSGSTLTIEDVDVVDGTPLLDVKPFVPDFDNPRAERIGWLTKQASRLNEVRADRRFADPPPK